MSQKQGSSKDRNACQRPIPNRERLKKRDKNWGEVRKITRNKWYPFQITKIKRTPSKTCRLRRGLTPGTVVILLVGPFRGKRVIFLKQLEKSGQIAVTGPLAINGVPLRRVGQRFVIITSTKTDISKVDTSMINDYYFNKGRGMQRLWKLKQKKRKFYNELKKRMKERKVSKRETQLAVDKGILEELNGEYLMKKYLSSYWSIVPGQPPHAVKF